MRITIQELENHKGEDLTVQGFVDNIRDLQYVQFVILRDETGKVQMTVEKNEENQALVEIISNLTLESTVLVEGTLLDSPKVKLRGMELLTKKIEVTSTAPLELPIDIKNKDAALRETRLDYRLLDLRRDENNLLFRAQTLILNAMRNYWFDHGFIEINSPKICAQAAESGAEVFHLDYFGTPACLSQSPQFYKQMAMAANFGKVFEIAPAFRAENSHTSYHATEIQMIDAEISWITSCSDVMDMEEDWLRYVFKTLKEKMGDEIQEKMGIEISDATPKFPRIPLLEAKEIIKEKYGFVGERKNDLERKEEELICKYVKEKYNSDFVFITKWPFEARPFYHMKDSEGYSDSYDLLFKGLEITTGAQREHRRDILEQQMIEKELDPKDFAFYLDFFKYGCPPHGGFGFGLARLMMQIFEIDNIREATFIYRGPTRLNP